MLSSMLKMRKLEYNISICLKKFWKYILEINKNDYLWALGDGHRAMFPGKTPAAQLIHD